ncbi:hypothetical protein [Streptomyces lydicus]|uniref:hypothetical protein n=1 Tax=Streptomyces lydicus TaxID=47763 RepID=UPI003316F2C8
MPAVGQIWADNDPRCSDRYVLIVDLDATHATVRQIAYNPQGTVHAHLPGTRVTRIRRTRLRPTSNGYRYVEEALNRPRR